ncbi:MAG: YebC/PmpR family DNA-binding transcriptional regulator [Patescibacteria group bacterium]
MSGHSKWATTKHKKEAVDKKRGTLFTKLGNAVAIATRQGSDPEMNFSLRLAIDRAKAANVPKENIERAIKKGSGEVEGSQLEEIIYEGFGPGKISIIIETLTDNKNRTVAEIKHILDKSGGTLGGQGSVMWQFEQKGCLSIMLSSAKEKLNCSNNEEIELKLIDFNIDDVKFNNDQILIYTKPENLQQTKKDLEKIDIKINSVDISFIPKEKQTTDDETKEKIQSLFDTLDEHPDVVNYYTNLI